MSFSAESMLREREREERKSFLIHVLILNVQMDEAPTSVEKLLNVLSLGHVQRFLHLIRRGDQSLVGEWRTCDGSFSARRRGGRHVLDRLV